MVQVSGPPEDEKDFSLRDIFRIVVDEELGTVNPNPTAL